MVIYLYLKTHNVTGFKYLGKTNSINPHEYRGSGKLWRRHIEKHGYDVTTQILLESNSKEEIAETGIFFSKIFNVVKSKEFANLMEEKGDGGWGYLNREYWTYERRSAVSKSNVGWNHSEETKLKLSKPKSEEHRIKLSESRKKLKGKFKLTEEHKKSIGKSNKGKTRTEEEKKKMSDICREKYPTRKCIHCGLIGGGTAMNRYHFDNCKHKLDEI